MPVEESLSTFELLKADAANAGIENMGAEITKLRLLRSIGFPVDPFAAIPIKVLQVLKRRTWNEKASEMREHPDEIRYALLARPGQNGDNYAAVAIPVLIPRIAVHAGIPATESLPQIAVQRLRPDLQ
jgi:hypothetical protein